MIPLQQPKHKIKEIYDSYEQHGICLVENGRTYLVLISEIIEGRYLKKKRTHENSLAPGKKKNTSSQDSEAGKMKWIKIKNSMLQDGYDESEPIEFVIHRENKKRKLHQGHHRICIANDIGMKDIPVVFRFV